MAGDSSKHMPQEIPVDLIISGPFQARQRFDQTALTELASSIAESGVVQPVIVRPFGEQYQLLAGERRWRAAQLAGLDSIPAIVREDLTDREASVLGLIENLQRESLATTETARGLKALAEQFELTHEQISERIGKSRVYVTNYLRLLHLAPFVQTLLDDEKLSLGHGKVLAGLPKSRQEAVAREVIRRGLSVRGLERLLVQTEERAWKRDARRKPDLTRLENQISDTLGNRVRIRYDPNSGRGSLVVSFHNMEEFEGILDRLDVSLD